MAKSTVAPAKGNSNTTSATPQSPAYSIVEEDGYVKVKRNRDGSTVAAGVWKDGKVCGIDFVQEIDRRNNFVRTAAVGLLSKYQANAAALETSVREICTYAKAPAVEKPAPAPAAKAKGNGKVTEAEELAAPETIGLPIALLKGALSVAPKDDKHRPMLCGIFIHAVDDQLRLVATDGHRMMVASPGEKQNVPAWARTGVIVGREMLAESLVLLGKVGDGVYLKFGENMHHVELSDALGLFKCSVSVIGGPYPKYQQVINSQSGALCAVDRAALESASIDPAYLKGAGALAQVLKAEAVTPFIGSSKEAVVFSINAVWPTMLYVMPKLGSEQKLQVNESQLRLVGPTALKGTLAALRAHHTRCKQSLSGQKSDKERAAVEAKMAGIQARIDAVIAASAKPLPAPAKAV
jgi:DNA polymerase III beta subunit, central domain